MSLSKRIDAYLDKQVSYPRMPETTRSALVAQIKKHPEAYAMAPIKLRWTEPTEPENVHPDNWIEFLPPRPKKLPSMRQLSRMPKTQIDALFKDLLAYNAIILAGSRTRNFYPCDANGRFETVKNARRRMKRLIERGQQFGVFRRMG